MIQLVAAARAVLDRPQLTARVECGALDVAVTVRPDLRPRPVAADEWIVARDRAVRVDPHDLADRRRQVLHPFAGVAVTERDEQRPIGTEHQPRAPVDAGPHLRLLAPDHPRVLEAGLAEPAARHRRAGPARAGLGERQVDQAVLGEARAERDVEEASLADRMDGRHASERRRQCAVASDQPEPARPLGDQQAPVGQERESPGMLEPAGDLHQAPGQRCAAGVGERGASWPRAGIASSTSGHQRRAHDPSGCHDRSLPARGGRLNSSAV